MGLFELFYEIGVNKVVIIKDECEKKMFRGKFGDVSMKYGSFKVCKVIEEDGIMIIYI